MVQGVSKNTATGVALTNQDKRAEKPDPHTVRKAGTQKQTAATADAACNSNSSAVLTNCIVNDGCAPALSTV